AGNAEDSDAGDGDGYSSDDEFYDDDQQTADQDNVNDAGELGSESDAPLEAAAPAAVKSGRGIAWFALLLALLGLAGGAYLGYEFLQQQQREETLGNMAEKNHQQILGFQRALESAQSSVAEERAARQQAQASLQQALRDANASIEGHSRRLLSLTATTTDDWRLAEVEYLLRLANQRILTSKDGKTAINLLQAADQILLELGDPRLFPIREALANDKAALALVGDIDLDGVFLQLAALGRQINQLPILEVPEFAAVAVEQDSAAAAGSAASDSAATDNAAAAVGPPSWLASLQEIASSTWSEIKSLVVIQQRDADIKPLLPPEQQYYLRNNLRLLINQAQIALLDGRQVPYSESLASAEAWLREHFPMQEQANQRAAQTLRELSAVPVSAEYPDVSASLLAIKGFIAEQHRLGQGGGKGKAP
ncbi:MAG: uroporphyrinogen-III C-methyltransferase, partial [Gammaproteobacteria bacterium]|nr:uroporphyrinogen-III C-methyltransferase [Gammaproteobacteria bacterium]